MIEVKLTVNIHGWESCVGRGMRLRGSKYDGVAAFESTGHRPGRCGGNLSHTNLVAHGTRKGGSIEFDVCHVVVRRFFLGITSKLSGPSRVK